MLTGAFVFEKSLNVPFWDDYAFFHFLNDFYDNVSFKNFVNVVFRQHNEHRIVFPKLIVFLDHIFFGDISFKRLIIYANVVMLLTIALLHNIYKDVYILFLICLCVLIPRIELNFWALSGLQNIGVLAWSFGTVKVLEFGTTWRNLFYAGLLCIGGILTSASGILVFAIVGLYIYVNKKKLFSTELIIWSIFSLIVLALYLINYKSPPGHPGVLSGDLTSFINLPLHSLRLTMALFKESLPMIRFRLLFGIALHIGGLFILFNYRRRLLDHPMHLAVFLITLLNSWLISLSRYGFGGGQAESERYELISALLVVSFIALVCQVSRPNIKLRVAVASLLMFNYALTVRSKIPRVDFHKSKLMAATTGYEGKIGQLVQFPDANAAFNWMNRSIERGLYINPTYKENQVTKEVYLGDMQPSKEVLEAWGVEANSSDKLFVSGWGVVSDITSDNFDIYMAFRSRDTTYLFSTFRSKREDVTVALGDEVNYNNSGFNFYSSKEDLNVIPGVYSCSIVLKSRKGNEIYKGKKRVKVEIARLNNTFKIIDIKDEKQQGIISAFGVQEGEVRIVDGWAFLVSDPSFQSDKEVLLKLEGESRAYSFTPDVVFRDDVTAHFNDGNNYDFSGFQISLSPKALNIPKGKYQLGIRLMSPSESAIQFIDQYITIR